MKTSKILKHITIITVFSIAFIGVNIIRKDSTVKNQGLSQMSLISLGAQSMAYCNEKQYATETLDGVCSGEFNAADSRCNYSEEHPIYWDCVKYTGQP